MKNGIITMLIALFAIAGLQDSAQAKENPLKFRAASLNIQAGLNTEQSISDLRKAVNENPDAIAFQEIGGEYRAAAMKAELNKSGYDFLRLDGPAQATPVAWKDSRWNKVDHMSWFLSERTFVRVPGAGPRWLEAKEATVVILKSTQGHGKVIFISAHLCPQPELNRERNELHTAQVERLVKLVEKLKGDYPGAEIVLAGDTNTEEEFRYDSLVAAGLTLSPFVKTHKNGALDHVASTMTPGYTYAIGGLHTDHKLLISNLKEN